ncbi:MAG: cell division protein ZipA C-terminal FtsZ-binding domain-containing protein [Gammaproteobacteria bacterium]
MGAELRWILLGLSVPLLALIWWWTARRSGQAPGNAELRESTAGKPPETAPPLDPRYADADDEQEMRPRPEPRDWGVPPFEPLHIRTAEFDRVPILDGPMMVDMATAPHDGSAPVSAPAMLFGPALGPRSVPVLQPMPAAASAPASTPLSATPSATAEPSSEVPASITAGVVGDHHDRSAAMATPAPNAAELQRIVTIRVCGLGEMRWSGSQLMAALELHGLAFGRYQVFHRKHADGRSLFCVASLIEPGTFDIAAMAEQEFRGITLFAVMPGPVPPVETMDELLGTARGLAEELSGMVQDAKGFPLSPQRAAALREDAARFQASLAGH